jgi:methylthioribose-1-phosphate isomerase
VIHAIQEMIVRGAPAIGVTGAYGMVLAAQKSSSMKDLARYKAALDAARPTAVNLTWATSRMLRFAERHVTKSSTSSSTSSSTTSYHVSRLVPIMLDEAERIADGDIEINLRMAKVGASIVPTFAHRPTHISHRCNTGSLATVDWGTALGVVHYCHKIEGRRLHVWVDETRPRLQGSRLTAWELTQANIPMSLIVDGKFFSFSSSLFSLCLAFLSFLTFSGFFLCHLLSLLTHPVYFLLNVRNFCLVRCRWLAPPSWSD